MGAALTAVGTMMSGGKEVQPVDFHALKDMLPASAPGCARAKRRARAARRWA